MNRQFKLDEGTIGSLKCEMALEALLFEHKDVKLTNKVMSRHQASKAGFQQILNWMFLSGSSTMIRRILLMWRKEQLNHWYDTCHNFNVPSKVKTHVITCLKTQYKIASGVVKDWEKKKRGQRN